MGRKGGVAERRAGVEPPEGHDDLHKSGFSISNPQAKSTCGCGSSFTM